MTHENKLILPQLVIVSRKLAPLPIEKILNMVVLISGRYLAYLACMAICSFLEYLCYVNLQTVSVHMYSQRCTTAESACNSICQLVFYYYFRPLVQTHQLNISVSGQAVF